MYCLPIDTDLMQPPMQELITLAQKHSLSAYDALYVRLSLVKHLPVATLDRRIADACTQEGTFVFNP
jgi:predicted nucleic acid-binding protein